MKGNEKMKIKITKPSNCVRVLTIVALLFSIVMAIIICALYASNETDSQIHEESTQQSLSYTVNVTSPNKNNTDPFYIDSWVVDLFTKEDPIVFYDVSAAKDDNERMNLIASGNAPFIEVSLAEYVKDVHLSLSHKIDKVNADAINAHNLIGISSLECDEQLLSGHGFQITWEEGYDESIFSGEELLCIIPENLAEAYDNGKGQAVLDFSTSGVLTVTMVDGKPVLEIKKTEYQCTLNIVGSYTGGDEKSIYCPALLLQQIYGELGAPLFFRSLSATVADSSSLEEFQEKMKLCFIEPSTHATEIPWGRTMLVEDSGVSKTKHYDYYPYAIEIEEEIVEYTNISDVPESESELYPNAMVIIIVFSIISGFSIGFFKLYSKRRDIMQMQTTGNTKRKFSFCFILEQILCIVLGIAIGGVYYHWQPIDKLGVFAIVYFIGFVLSLIIFMTMRSIRTIKEDQ